MTALRIKKIVFHSIYAVVCLIIILLQSTGLLPLKIYTASAVLIIPASIYAGFYFGWLPGAIFGFGSGILLDVYSSASCYNVVALTVCGFVCGALMDRLFNRNIAAACVLNLAVAFAYFFAKWMLLYAFVDPVPGYILMNYTLPSAAFTAACGIVMYFIVAPIFGRLPDIRRKF